MGFGGLRDRPKECCRFREDTVDNYSLRSVYDRNILSMLDPDEWHGDQK